MRNNPWDYLEEENSKQQEQKSTRERLYLACVGQPRGWSGSGGVNESLLGMKTQTWRGPDPVGRCRASSDWTGKSRKPLEGSESRSHTEVSIWKPRW